MGKVCRGRRPEERGLNVRPKRRGPGGAARKSRGTNGRAERTGPADPKSGRPKKARRIFSSGVYLGGARRDPVLFQRGRNEKSGGLDADRKIESCPEGGGLSRRGGLVPKGGLSRKGACPERKVYRLFSRRTAAKPSAGRTNTYHRSSSAQATKAVPAKRAKTTRQ